MSRYLKTADLATRIPVFPLPRFILLPGSSIPLRIFEPRYLEMIDYVLKNDRLVGMIQPVSHEKVESKEQIPDDVELQNTGCAGRLTGFSELDDGTLHIQLTGIARFHLVGEVMSDYSFRLFNVDYQNFEHDLVRGYGENDVDRGVLLSVLRAYLHANNIETDWESIHGATTEHIVNTLSIMSPYDCEEKQALLEAKGLKERAEILIALAEMDLASGGEGGSTNLQ